jgi:hypothetical protein
MQQFVRDAREIRLRGERMVRKSPSPRPGGRGVYALSKGKVERDRLELQHWLFFRGTGKNYFAPPAPAAERTSHDLRCRVRARTLDV